MTTRLDDIAAKVAAEDKSRRPVALRLPAKLADALFAAAAKHGVSVNALVQRTLEALLDEDKDPQP